MIKARDLRMCMLACGLLLLACMGCAAAAPVVVVLSVDGAISPATADYVVRGLRAAADADEPAQLVVLKMDTPGGLDTSMRQIIKQIIASPVPVAAFVAPDGARAASAGTYILYASHIAAMAPATNLGAATPIAIGIGSMPEPGAQPPRDGQDGAGPQRSRKPEGDGMPAPGSTLAHKQINDAAAYIRSLAQMRGRNVEWAEQAVREAVSLSAVEALKLRVIEVVAADVPGLLRQVDGRKVNVLGAERTLNVAGARIVTVAPDWRSRLLSVIADPSVAYLLMLAGVFGLFFEFSNPGFVLPGVVGAISLLLGLFAFQVLPVNYAGLALILLGIVFMAAEVFIAPGFGVLGIGGIAAFVIGSVMLIHTDLPGYGVPWSVILPVTAASALFIFLVAGMALRARTRPVVSGSEQMMGSVGVVLSFAGTEGEARVHGETWRIGSAQPLAPGQKVRVVGMSGLRLEVVPEAAPADE
ncbi:MAG TPA: nodulation protein NfeD [Gallionellaceae bacterium]